MSAILTSEQVDQLHRMCLAAGGHDYEGATTIHRDYLGHVFELRICQRCKVPESPKVQNGNRSHTRSGI